VVPGDDLGPRRVDVGFVVDLDIDGKVGFGDVRLGVLGRGAGGRHLVQVVARGVDMVAVDVQAVGRPGGQARRAGDRVLVGRRLQVGGDAVARQHVEQVLADPGIDVADGVVLGRAEAVVTPSSTAARCWHAAPLPRRASRGDGYAAVEPPKA
jgi:hypothetical protein